MYTQLDINREWDLNVFLSYPKCIGNWSDDNGAGCILTAFFAAWGIDLSIDNRGKYLKALHNIARDLGLVKVQTMPVINHDDSITWKTGVHPFPVTVTSNYDCGKPEVAYEILWELIEKLPNKKNWLEVKPTLEACNIPV